MMKPKDINFKLKKGTKNMEAKKSVNNLNKLKLKADIADQIEDVKYFVNKLDGNCLEKNDNKKNLIILEIMIKSMQDFVISREIATGLDLY